MREIAIGLATGVGTGALVGATGSVFLGALLCGAAGLVAGIGLFDARIDRTRLITERDAAVVGARDRFEDWTEFDDDTAPQVLAEAHLRSQRFLRLGPGWDGLA